MSVQTPCYVANPKTFCNAFGEYDLENRKKCNHNACQSLLQSYTYEVDWINWKTRCGWVPGFSIGVGVQNCCEAFQKMLCYEDHATCGYHGALLLKGAFQMTGTGPICLFVDCPVTWHRNRSADKTSGMAFARNQNLVSVTSVRIAWSDDTTSVTHTPVSVPQTPTASTPISDISMVRNDTV